MPPQTGAIVLAAFEPDHELFARQLQSLQAQTVSEWECVVSVDGDPGRVSRIVAEATGADSRFRVIGDGRRLGFYLNFERGLRAVAEDAAWVALCDQDDYWYPDKLAGLLPHLEEVSMVSGLARLVSHPAGADWGTTVRRDEGALPTVLLNQYTGSLCIMTKQVVEAALPFPRVRTHAAAHDHWLAVVAFALRGARIAPVVHQDYVQHAANVFGDPRAARKRSLIASVRNAHALARRYEGGSSLLSLLRVTFWVYVGWRQLMVDTLDDRGLLLPDDERVRRVFGRTRTWGAMRRDLAQARAIGFVPTAFALQYHVSWVAGALSGGRGAVRRASTTSSA